MTDPALAFTCGHCGETFRKTVENDIRAKAEAFDRWGVRDADKHPAMAVVCDDCYKVFLEWYLNFSTNH